MPRGKKIINEGGINGTGGGLVNVNSNDFIGLREAITEHAKKQTLRERITYELLSLRYQMESYISTSKVIQLIEVGEFLKSHLKAIGVKNKEFAKYIDIDESNLSSIITGRRKISVDLAFKLGQLFDINPNYWLLIQSKNQLLKIDSTKKSKYRKYKLNGLLKKMR